MPEHQGEPIADPGPTLAASGGTGGAIKAWAGPRKTPPDPKLVQATITRIRRRITRTTPEGVGKQAAFAKAKAAPKLNSKTSIEAVGGSADEARHDVGD